MRVALPKGRLLGEISELLRRAGWGLSGYTASGRLYRLKSVRFPEMKAKIFHEKDIPVQVAIGNYDLGICGLDWVEELEARFPGSALVKVSGLGCGTGQLYVAVSRARGVNTIAGLKSRPGPVRIASEYPNLADSFALGIRLRRFSVVPLWGAAEVYPPESADMVLVAAGSEEELEGCGLLPVSKVLDFGACLIANKTSWETGDMSRLLDSIQKEAAIGEVLPTPVYAAPAGPARGTKVRIDEDTVLLALPDGHQQEPTVALLERAGIQIDDYPSKTGNRRPTAAIDGLSIKVIRPQDMPLQVANGNFDLAITGRDWLLEHLYQFPSSPVTELLSLNFGGVRIVAVVSKEFTVDGVDSLRRYSDAASTSLRVASEYVNIADKYARDNHLGMYRVIPTWGATEAFLPEDADLLIENTQTGRTLARHGLKIIDTLFESTACLIGQSRKYSSAKRERIDSLIEALRRAVEEEN